MTSNSRPPNNTVATLAGRRLTKSFPGVRALDGVDLVCRPGRVHALVGENGAGKSTLVRVLTGNTAPDSGKILFDGVPVTLPTPRHALRLGITAVHQELTVLPELTVAENVLLGQEPVSRGLLDLMSGASAVTEALARVGLADLDPGRRAESLSLANRQLVEIARALVRRSRVLILDEPSAVLSGDKLEALFAVVRSLAAHGVAVVYISHLLDEVRALADDITVLRDGATVSSGLAHGYDVRRIVREMVGRDVDTVYPTLSPPSAQPVLDVRGLVPRTDGPPPPPVDLEVCAGEIVGLAGLVGSGRSRLLRTLAGARASAAGTIRVKDSEVAGTTGGPRRAGTTGGLRRAGTTGGLRRAMAAGMVLVPEERKSDGLVLGLPVRANTTLAALRQVCTAGWLSVPRERAVFNAERERLGIRVSSPDQDTGQLSGGNQQKVVLAKWLRRQPSVLLLDEPTRGVDVGAKAEIYRLVAELAEQGMAVLLASSELPEVLGLAHRVLVCRGGGIVGELTGPERTEENLMHLALGTNGAAGVAP